MTAFDKLEAAASKILGFAGKIEDWAKGFWRWVERNAVLVALLFFVLNLWLKGGRAGEASIFLDEAVSIYQGQEDIKSIVLFSLEDPTPPLYYLVLGFWIKLFGISEFAVRMPSVLFSSISAALIFLIGRRLGNNKLGLMAGIFFSFSQTQLIFAQEARAYSLGVMLFLLSSYLFLGFFDAERQGWGRTALFALVNTALLFCHYSMGFGLLGQAFSSLWLLRRNKMAFVKTTLAYLVAFGAILPWFMANQAAMPTGKVSSWLKPPSLDAVRNVIFYIGGQERVLWVMLALMLLGVLALFKEWKQVRATLRMGKFGLFFLLASFCLGIGAQFTVSHLVTPMFQARYLQYLDPLLFLILAWLLALLPKRNVSQPLAMLLVWILLMVQLDRAPKKAEEWREASSLLKTWTGPKSAVIVNAYYCYMPLSYYYARDAFQIPDSTTRILSKRKIFGGKDTTFVPVLDGNRFEDVVLVLCGEEVADPENILYNTTASKFCLIDKAHFRNIDLFKFGPKPCTKVWEQLYTWDYEQSRVEGDDSMIVQIEDAPSGSNVAYVGPGKDYSVAYRLPVKELGNIKPDLLRIMAKGKYLVPNAPLRLVMSLESGGESYDWQGIHLEARYAAGGWFQIMEQLPLPPFKTENDVIVIYFWAMKGDEAWFDDLQLEFLEE